MAGAGCTVDTLYRRAGARPRRQLPGTSPLPPNPLHAQVCHCEPARTLVWQSVPLQAVRLARPAGGAIPARAYDRPHGRCNAFALRGNGLPRRCAPHNDRFGGLVRWGEGARQICRCPAGVSPRPTGAPLGAGCVGMGALAGLHRRAGVLPPPSASRNLPAASKPTALPGLSLRTSAHAGVAIRFPASRKACAPRQGRNIGPGA